MHDNPKICIGHAVCGGKEKLKGSSSKDKGELKGNLLIRELWTQGTDIIHDTHVGNTDATSYQSKPPEKCLETAEKEKKKYYLDACLKQRQQFPPFVTSVDRLIGVEAQEKLNVSPVYSR